MTLQHDVVGLGTAIYRIDFRTCSIRRGVPQGSRVPRARLGRRPTTPIRSRAGGGFRPAAADTFPKVSAGDLSRWEGEGGTAVYEAA